MRSADPTGREAVELLGLLAEEARLRVLAALVLGATTTAEVATAAGIGRRATLQALNRLAAGGLAESAENGWRARPDRIKDLARAAAPPPDTDDHGAADPGAAAVLRTFLDGGRLVSIPAAHAKRLVVLDHIARLFEPGRRYTEREVSTALRAFHADYAALRRYLVDEGFLEREAGEYWRAGGTVELD
ncbi:MAG: DUF2087 domain-containing protein [Actinomycetota bacterium]|nr:DUF2087 domain-containing protein [Actinomycetota bacterium]